MSNWKYIIFLIPAITVFTGAMIGVNQDLPIINMVTSGIKGSNNTVEAQTVAESSDNSEEETEEIKKASNHKLKLGKWKDGTYYGTAKGYGGNIKVSVVIKDGKISDIKVLEHSNETPEFYDRAKVIVNRILSARSTNVDTVSNATLSSNGILQAVIQALNQAVVDEKDKVNSNSANVVHSTNTKTTTTKKKNKIAKGMPADGTYEGSAVCENFDYTISIKVTFKNGKATKIFGLKITNNDDSANEAYWIKAYKPTVKKLLKNQNSNVDVVSGATYSSNAIAEAFEDAKSKAIAKNSSKPKKTVKKKTNSKNKNNKTPIIKDDSKLLNLGQVKDGTYHAWANCYPDEDEAFEMYTMYADVTFVGGKLTRIEKFSSNAESNKKYYQKAANGTNKYKGVVSQLIEKQSASGISAVSGSTCSSKTIVEIYVEALKHATGKEIEIIEETTEEVAEENADNLLNKGNQNDENSDFTPLLVKDGTYLETVWVEPDEDEEFDPYSMLTQITFELGVLKDFVIVSATDDSNEGYYMRAFDGTKKQPGIVEQLKNNPSKEPDIVSGATCSFIALYEAFMQALNAAAQ